MQLANQIHRAFHHLIEGGHHDAAGWLIQKMLDEYPDHARAHNDWAVLAHDAGDTQTAQHHYERAADLAPGNFAIQIALAHFYHVSLQDPEKALTQYKKALALEPQDIGAMIIAGHLSVGQREFDQARQFYQQVLVVDPEHADARQSLEKLDQCGSLQTTDEPPESADSFYQRGLGKAQSGDLGGAIEDLELTLNKEPDHALAHNDLGVLYYQQGDKQKALEHYERAAAKDPYNAVFQKNLGDFYFAERIDGQAALERYVEALRLNPDDTETLINTGQICVALGKSDDARHFFQRTLEIDPTNNDLRKLMDRLDSKADASIGSLDRRECLEQVQSPTTPGDNDAKVSDLEKLVAHDPGNAMAYNDLGVLYYSSGQKEKAVGCYERAVELAPDQINYKKNLADFYLMEQSRIEEAMKIYVAVLENNPQDVESILAVGLVCAAMHNFPEARGFYQRALEIEPWNENAKHALDLLDQAEREIVHKNEAALDDTPCGEQSVG
jgi:tetratricopeptide (TPR) repeat protein